jgi:hypothetical protein
MSDKKIHIVRTFLDDDYCKNHCQGDVGDRKWRWGIGDDNKLYSIGTISGFHFLNWTEFSHVNLPFTAEEICRLADFIRNVQ